MRSRCLAPSICISEFSLQMVLQAREEQTQREFEDQQRKLFCSRGTSEHALSADEPMSQIRDLIFQMTRAQRNLLAKALGVHVSSAKFLHDHCTSIMASAEQPGDVAVRRELAVERFFRDNAPRRDEAHDNGLASPTQDCRENRARSASPRVDLTALRFDCSICLVSAPALTTVVMPCCGFELCRDCAKQSVQSIMATCNADNRIRCLHCGSNILNCRDGKHMLQALVGAIAMLAWRAQLALNSVPNCWQCSACNRIQLVTSKSPAPPSVICACGHVTCLEHGDAHPGMPCPLPSLQHIESEAKISRISKRCPGCKVATERNGGCSHMSCSKCGCDWCWICAKLYIKSRSAGRREVLDTDADTSTNWISALLFRIICYAAGPSCVFSITDDYCNCGNRGTRGLDVEWRRSDRLVSVSLQPFAQSIVSTAIVIGVHLFELSQSTHPCALLLSTYAFAAAVYILTACCSRTFGMAAADASFFYSGADYYYPQFFSQVAAAVLAQASALLVGICVAVITLHAYPILRLLGRSRLYPYNRPLECSDFVTATKAVVPASLAYLYFIAPLEPHQSAWILDFWIVWAALQLHVMVNPTGSILSMSILNSYNPNHDSIDWALVCGALSTALSLVMSGTRFICCLDAAVCVLCVLKMALHRRLN